MSAWLALCFMALFSAWSHAASVTLTWDGVDGVSGYRLYRSYGVGAFEPLARQTNIGAEAQVSATDSTRFYVVSYSLDLTESNPSNVVTNMPAIVPQPVPVPSAPFLKATGVSAPRRVDLSWTGRYDSSTEVERSIKAAPFERIATLPPGTLFYTDPVRKRRDYRYRVRQFNVSGIGEWSNIVYWSE